MGEPAAQASEGRGDGIAARMAATQPMAVGSEQWPPRPMHHLPRSKPTAIGSGAWTVGAFSLADEMTKVRVERRRLLAQFGGFYERHEFERMPGSFGCFYCAEPADTIDHTPPLSWIESRRMEDWRSRGIKLLTVPCCGECNRTLGSRALFTPLDRATYLERWLLNKYDRAGRLWSEEEIAEMSKDFQRTIRARKREAERLLVRARAAQWRLQREIEAIDCAA